MGRDVPMCDRCSRVDADVRADVTIYASGVVVVDSNMRDKRLAEILRDVAESLDSRDG